MGKKTKEITTRLRNETFSFASFPLSLSAKLEFYVHYNWPMEGASANCHTFEKLTDTFCLRSSPSCAVTLPNKNSTITDTISVEVLEYCTVYETLEKGNKSIIKSERGKKMRVLGTDFSFCLVKDVPWSSPFSFLLCRKYYCIWVAGVVNPESIIET